MARYHRDHGEEGCWAIERQGQWHAVREGWAKCQSNVTIIDKTIVRYDCINPIKTTDIPEVHYK